MCFHEGLIIFVRASVRHKNDGAIDRAVCEYFIETNIVPTTVTDDCGTTLDTRLNDGE